MSAFAAAGLVPEGHEDDPPGVVGRVVACIRAAGGCVAASKFVPDCRIGALPTPGEPTPVRSVGSISRGEEEPEQESQDQELDHGGSLPGPGDSSDDQTSSATLPVRPQLPPGRPSHPGLAAGPRRTGWEVVMKHEALSKNGKRRLIHVPTWLFYCLRGRQKKTQFNILAPFEALMLSQLTKTGSGGPAKVKSHADHLTW